MNLLAATAPNPTHAPMPNKRRVWTVSALVCVGLTLLQTAAAISDHLHAGTPVYIWQLLIKIGLKFLPMFFFCTVLYLQLQQMGEQIAWRKRIGRLYLLTIVIFYLPDYVYQALIWDILAGKHTWAELSKTLADSNLQFVLWDFLMFNGIFAAVFALNMLSVQLSITRRQQQTEAENLNLRLALEQQRMAALQAQLEPHFMFNALNAISALVRADDKRLAITALSRLSMLLRYALTAGSQEWVKLSDELRFVRDYLALQHLRFGERLQITVVGDTDEALLNADFPPLLLQPLVENALRHDLERHDGNGDIHLALQREGNGLRVLLSNPLRDDSPTNPGCGLGLNNTRERLRLAYGETGSIETRHHQGRFEVILHLPIQGHD